MMTYRKIGGIHWFTLGPFRIAFCRVKTKPLKLQPINKWVPMARLPHINDFKGTNNLLNW